MSRTGATKPQSTQKLFPAAQRWVTHSPGTIMAYHNPVSKKMEKVEVIEHRRFGYYRVKVLETGHVWDNAAARYLKPFNC